MMLRSVVAGLGLWTCSALVARVSRLPQAAVSRKVSRLGVSHVEDDGYVLAKHKLKRQWVLGRLSGPTQPGNLILVRHGESLWNQNSTFSGWADVDLSDRGRLEVEHAHA